MGVIFFYKLRQRLQLQQLGDFMFAVKRSQAIFKRHFFNLFHGPKLLKEFYEELSQYTRCHRVLMKLLSAFCAHQISSDTPHTSINRFSPTSHLPTGDSLVVEVSYPACPGPRDKVPGAFVKYLLVYLFTTNIP